MKRTFLIASTIFLLVTTACSLFSAAPAQLAPTAIEKPQVIQPETTNPPETSQPTSIPTESPPASTVTGPPPEVNAATTAPQSQSTFEDTFDKKNDAWSEPFVVTSQAVGHEPLFQISVAAGVMRFNLQDLETYVYRYYSVPIDSNQTIHISYEPRGSMTNGVAAVCKANPDKTAWFEMRLTPENSKYNFYQFDSQLKEDGKNPYILLGQGVLAVKDFPPAKANVFTFSCNQNELMLDINDGKRVITQPIDEDLPGKYVGVGVMSYNKVPVTIDFKTVTIKGLG